jgi:flagellin-specific chaperone FliS
MPVFAVDASAQTAPPGQLVLMLYDGALKLLEQARPAYDPT